MGGVPTYWRTLRLDSRTDLDWANIYRRFDILSPWMVGRIRTPADAVSFAREVTKGDIAATTAAGVDYMPTVFPGFSWYNLKQGRSPLNAIPRLCGTFYNIQVKSVLSAGAKMLFTAMFDEVDEGTAIFKIVRRPAELPVDANLLAPDQSGCDPGSDLYLRLAGDATRHVRQAVSK